MAKVVKQAGKSTADHKPTMHGSPFERRLLAGKGALIRWNASHVPVTGDKPAKNNRRP